MIPKSRLDALTDGVFAVAMTLLVIDLRVPEGFDPKDAGELLHWFAHIWNQVLVYVISFYVLGLRWIGMVRTNAPGEEVSETYTNWAMAHLLLITFVPFFNDGGRALCLARSRHLALCDEHYSARARGHPHADVVETRSGIESVSRRQARTHRPDRGVACSPSY